MVRYSLSHSGEAIEFASKLRNDDEIAAELFRLHGADSWAWYYMSKRLKKKYKIEEK